MERNMTAQNVLLIQSAELVDDSTGLANWDGTGYYPPPLGTYLTGTSTATSDNTSGSATPGEPGAEILEGDVAFSYPTDDDQKETMELQGPEIYRDPGKEKLDLSLELYEELGTHRWVTAKRWNPTNLEYRRATKFPRYNFFQLSYPKDSSGNYIAVDEELSKSDIAGAAMVVWFSRVKWVSRATSLDNSDKVKTTMTGHAVKKRVFMNYTFDGDLLGSTGVPTAFSGATPDSLDSAIVIPTRMKIVISSWVAGVTMTITGTDVYGDALTEVVATTAAGTYYTNNVFASVNTNGLVCDATADFSAWISAKELY